MTVSRSAHACGAAATVLTFLAAMPAAAQSATETRAEAIAPQTPAANAAIGEANTVPESADEIVVTGTSIRGAPPVGSNLISVGRAEIEDTGAQSVQQILKTVPAVVGLGSAAQGSFGSADGAGTNAPTIHGLGASASNSTLIILDGHRFPLGGINHTLGDPNIIPTIAIERVEVLPDGASAVYGSDAVAGVINFITRRKYDGFEANAQVGFGDDYRTYSAAGLAGKAWDTGSILAAYSFSQRSSLSAGDRARFTKGDKRDLGGSNLASFACSPATIQPTGSANIFAAPYTGAGVANAPANAFCDFSGLTDLLPREVRHNMIVKATQEIGDAVTVTGDVVYSNRRNRQNVSRGNVTATIFGPGSGRGSQINPFYQGVPGNAATSETVRFQADDLLGPGAKIYGGQEDFYVHATAEWRVNDNWRLTVGGVYGFDNSRQQNVGQLCGSCANLALNGTTNGAGSLTTPSIPATGVTVTQALTTANALDVFGVGSANRTSGAVRAALIDSTTTQLARQTIKDATANLNGSLFALPAGDVKVAIGGELIKYTLKQDITRPTNTGPASSGSATVNLNYDRSVESAYVEALIPIVSADMEIPLIRAFDLNLSGRYDHYSDFGSTTNPKIAANWEVIEGIKLRGNYARSFVAPALTSRGSNQFGVTGESGFTGSTTAVTLPTALFPNAIGLPGCPGGSVTCQIGGTTIQGIQLNGGNAALQPQKGRTYSLGADFTPTFIPGFRLGVTYWYNRIRGGITAPTQALAVNSPDLTFLLQLFPNGATPAQIAAATAGLPQTGTLPNITYFIYNFQQRNVLNLTVTGLDIDANYRIDTGDFGRFTMGAAISRKLKFDQQIGSAGQVFSVLNTTGFNTTFPSIKLDARANIGWELGGLSADIFWNHTGGYRNWSANTVAPLTRNAQGIPTGGGDKVRAYNTFDLHAAYTLPIDFLKKAQIFVDANNVFDKDPPFYNSTNGYDTFGGNPIGRVITLGVRTSF